MLVGTGVHSQQKGWAARYGTHWSVTCSHYDGTRAGHDRLWWKLGSSVLTTDKDYPLLATVMSHSSLMMAKAACQFLSSQQAPRSLALKHTSASS